MRSLLLFVAFLACAALAAGPCITTSQVVVPHLVSSTLAASTPVIVSASCTAPKTFIAGGCTPQYLGTLTFGDILPSLNSTMTVSGLTTTCVFTQNVPLAANLWTLNAVASCCNDA